MVTDDFMMAVQSTLDGRLGLHDWRGPQEYDAVDISVRLVRQRECADQARTHSTINKWHMSNSGPIRASNPCSEYMFLDDTACNLSSINLVKFLDQDSNFDIEGYRRAIEIMFIAQEICVDFSSYPTAQIAKNSHDFRPLGLGYANLGALLMILGAPYDSDKAFGIAGALTAFMTGHAYKVSSEMAAVKSSFSQFEKNKAPMLKVMNQHRDAAYKIDVRHCPQDLLNAAREDWDDAVRLGEQHGYRNAPRRILSYWDDGLLMDWYHSVDPAFSEIQRLAGGDIQDREQLVQRALGKLVIPRRRSVNHRPYDQSWTLEGAPHI